MYAVCVSVICSLSLFGSGVCLYVCELGQLGEGRVAKLYKYYIIRTS